MNKVLIMLVICFSALTLQAGNLNLETADDLYDRLAYTKAAVFYKKYLKKNDDVEAWIKLADCYDKVNDYNNLEATLDTIVKHPELENDEVYFQYAQVLLILDKPGSAADYFQRYLDKNPENVSAKKQLEATRLPIKDESDRYAIENMEFNTNAFEYAPSILNGAFVYTSTTNEGNTSIRNHNWTGGSYSDLKQFDLDTLNVFFLFHEMNKLNTKFNDGTFATDPIDGTVYYTRNNYDVKLPYNKKHTGIDHNINLKIYKASHELGDFGKVEEFEHNFSYHNTGHPAISPDGQYFVFTSDFPEDNVGERDLYFSKKDDSTGGWTLPTLLTAEINTERDELFPYFHDDGSLYFASNGLGSMGGLDIFRAEIDFEANELIELEQLGAPINSTYDDFGLIFHKNGNGFFTSDRPGGKGNDDIYSFTDNSILLRGVVLNDLTGERLPGSYIMVGDEKVKLLEGETDSMARFETRVYRDKVYDVLADEDYFFPTTKQVSTKDHRGNVPINVTLRLQPIQYTVQVLETGTDKPISNTKVDIAFGCDENDKTVYTKLNGTSVIPTYKTCQYDLKAKAAGYLAGYKVWESPLEDSNYMVTIYLDPISFAPVVLHNIYYDFDESYLRISESSEDLDKVYTFLMDNPELTVQINSHTDARGTKAYNEGLSQRRAKAVVDYLIGRQIPANRIKPVGFGERMLVNQCADGVKCTEEEHQLNRRTEFQVINVDGSVKIKSDARQDIETDPCKGCPF